MSIFLAKVSSKVAPATPAFSTRNIVDYTQAKPSELTIFAKPTFNQIAYSGYAKSLEAFLFATEQGKRVFCSLAEYPISSLYEPTVPIQFPPIVMRSISREPAVVSRLKEVLAPMGGKEESLGKGNQAFTIKNPTLKALRSGIPKASYAASPFLVGHASAQSGYWAARIIQMIDLFLRVHTYEFKGGETDEVDDEFVKRGVAVSYGELFLPGDLSKLPGASVKRRKLVDGKWESQDFLIFGSYQTKEEKAKYTSITMNQVVLTAKPSPHLASYNFGDPTMVPNKPGLFFPYFSGMIVPDTGYIREVVGELFFRNMGSEGTSSKDAWKGFRGDIATFSQTESGMETTHILAGCKLALDGQARLFLVFDGREYKGFCLLGDQFKVYIGGACIEPVGEEDLRKELSKVVTRQGSATQIKLLAEGLAGWEIGKEVDVAKIMDNTWYLADILHAISKLELSEEVETDISKALASLHFLKKYETPSPENIKKALTDISEAEAWDEEDHAQVTPFYIPIRGWKCLGDPIYRILARFGPNSISFFNSKGTEIKIAEKIEKDAGSPIFAPSTVKQKIYVYEKPLAVCVGEMMKVIRAGAIWQDMGERAGPQRAHTFNVDGRVKVVEGLIELRDHTAFGITVSKEVKVTKEYEVIKDAGGISNDDF